MELGIANKVPATDNTRSVSATVAGAGPRHYPRHFSMRRDCGSDMRATSKKPPALIAPGAETMRSDQAFKLSGTLPPLSASLIMTCLCSQTFILAESFISPV